MAAIEQFSSRCPRPRDEANKHFANDGSLESVERLLYRLSLRCYARAQAMGLAMTFDDVRQELNVGYLLARNTWNSERGILFSTYMTTCCYRHFNELVRRATTERKYLGLINMSDMMTGQGGQDEDRDELERMDTPVELNVVGLYGDLLVEGSTCGDIEAPMNADPAVLLEELYSAMQNRALARIKLRSMTRNTKLVLLDLIRAAALRHDDSERLPRLWELLRTQGFDRNECKRIRKEISNAFGVRVV